MLGSFVAEEFHQLHQRLVTTPGPSLGEEPRRLILEDFFDQCGLPHQTDAAGNLWLSLGPAGWDDAIVYDAHIDVVERGWAPKVEFKNGRMIGLGVGDNLTAVAMLALLAKIIISENLPLQRPLKLLFSVGEEGLGNLAGVRQAVSNHPTPPYLFISFDGSYETYSLNALGSNRYRVTVSCPGGHSWSAFGSPNAIEQVTDFFTRLKQAYAKTAAASTETVSFNIGTISGGEGINSIARSAEATFEFRSGAPILLAQMHQAVTSIVAAIATRPDVSIRQTIIGERPAAKPVCPERIEPLVRQALTKHVGEAEPVLMSTNINIPLSAGWPAICVGLCCCPQYHREDEFVELDSLPKGWAVLNEISQQLLQ